MNRKWTYYFLLILAAGLVAANFCYVSQRSRIKSNTTTGYRISSENVVETDEGLLPQSSTIKNLSGIFIGCDPVNVKI